MSGQPTTSRILDVDIWDEECDLFIDAFGELAVRESMPAIAGRIAALLHLSDRPVTFGELQRRLKVSRGSVSSNTRLLEDRGLIQRITMPGTREHSFRFVYDMKIRAAAWHVQKLRGSVEIILRTHGALRARTEGISSELKRKMEDLEDFYTAWFHHMDDFLQMMREESATPSDKKAGTRAKAKAGKR